MNFTRQEQGLDPAGLRLPLIALIDVVLFLLFYFMIAGTLAGEEGSLGAAVRTQAGGGASTTGEISTWTVNVTVQDEQPLFSIGSRSFRGREPLTALLAQLNKSGGVIVRASGEAPVSAVATAIQAARDAGFTRVSYVPGK